MMKTTMMLKMKTASALGVLLSGVCVSAWFLLCDASSSSSSFPPGFTRSVVRPDYAVVAAESFVFGGAQGWECGGCECEAAVLISPAMRGARFSMQIVRAKKTADVSECVVHGPGSGAHADMQRMVYVLKSPVSGLALVKEGGETSPLGEDAFAYFRPGSGSRLTLSGPDAVELLVFDSLYTAAPAAGGCDAAAQPEDQSGHADARPLVPVPGNRIAVPLC